MINLIPPAARRSIVKEYWIRVSTVWMSIFGTVSIILALLLLPAYVLVGMQISTLKQTVDQMSQKVASYDVSASELVAATTQAQIIVGEVDLPTFSTYINQLQTLAGNTVALRGIEFSRAVGTTTIALSGEATTRTTLANFRDMIEANPSFASVDLPISNLIKDRDVLFSMRIVVADSSQSKP